MSGKKHILITGATGYIGSELVDTLISLDRFELAIVVRDELKGKNLFGNKLKYISYNSLEYFSRDLKNFNPNIVVHLAAYSTSSDSANEVQKLIESNIVFTSQLLLALSECNIELFINTGSFSEYHTNTEELTPTYFYSATKTSARYMIEYFSKRDDFTFVNAILYTVYGKKGNNKKIIDYAVDSLGSSRSIAMSEGKQLLDFVHIDDVVAFYINLIENYKCLHISRINYDVGRGEPYSIRDMVSILEDITEKKANIEWGAYKDRKMDTIQSSAKREPTQVDLEYTSNISLREGLLKYLEVVE